MALASQWQTNIKYVMPNSTAEAIQRLHKQHGGYETHIAKQLLEERVRLLEAGLEYGSPYFETLCKFLREGPDLGNVKIAVLLDIVALLDEKGQDAALAFFRDAWPDIFQAADSLTGREAARGKS